MRQRNAYINHMPSPNDKSQFFPFHFRNPEHSYLQDSSELEYNFQYKIAEICHNKSQNGINKNVLTDKLLEPKDIRLR